MWEIRAGKHTVRCPKLMPFLHVYSLGEQGKLLTQRSGTCLWLSGPLLPGGQQFPTSSQCANWVQVHQRFRDEDHTPWAGQWIQRPCVFQDFTAQDVSSMHRLLPLPVSHHCQLSLANWAWLYSESPASSGHATMVDSSVNWFKNPNDLVKFFSSLPCVYSGQNWDTQTYILNWMPAPQYLEMEF